MRYDHRIDGLRAIAIFTVIIYHLNFFYNEFQILPGGFFGVDVFCNFWIFNYWNFN